VVAVCIATLVADPVAATPAELRAAGEAAVTAGFDAVSAWVSHLPALDGLRLPVAVVEAAMSWANTDAETAMAEARQLASVVAATGATKLVAVCLEPSITDVERARQNLGAVADIAAGAGAQVCVEFLPWSAIHDLATAWRLVEPLGDRAGLLLDTWHWTRQPGGPSYDLLRTIPGSRIGYLQLCDAAGDAGPAPMAEAMSGRLLPGEGVVDFGAVLAALDAIGAEPVVATEIFNPALLAARGGPAAATAMRAAADRILTSTGRIPGSSDRT
jgi:sugar phosphate isomerase/epimerase